MVVILVTVATAVASEAIYEKLMKQKITVGDLSAAVTGLLLALICHRQFQSGLQC